MNYKNNITMFDDVFFLLILLILIHTDLEIRDLNETQMDEICVLMDMLSTSDHPKYICIAEDAFDDLPAEQRNKNIEDLCTKEKKGMHFLEALMAKKGVIKIGEFCKVAVELERKDIQGFLEKKLSKEKTLDDLKLIDKTTLASLLSKEKVAVKNWRHFADKFGFSREEKQAIDNSRNNGHSPSRVLLKQNDKFAVMPLTEFKQRCDKHNFKELSKKIGEIMESQ